ncbi:hypothetical protein M9H77_27497 [Catharanthus roseus]|uniref:Uncharacterized protein n=1 Tax=Catharanthus roseus TaxID=4058 RepID=A0ACC0AD29_CATRO|nr:hypothetical protein M9H77_27497 [Catharanthus roseus]
MSLLDQLWDDTVAGPRPDSGLGKLRKYSTFNMRSNNGNGNGKESEVGNASRSFGSGVPEDAPRVTRSIMIVRPQGDPKDSPPVSPAGSTPPVSPFAGSLFCFLACAIGCPPRVGELNNYLRLLGGGEVKEQTYQNEMISAGGREAFRFRRRSASFAYEKANGVGPRSPPPPYDM